MKQRIGLINNIPLVIGDEHEVTSNEILIELSKTDPNKIDIKRRINGKLKKLTSEGTKTKIVNSKRHKVGKFIHYIRPATYSRRYTLDTGVVYTVPWKTFYCEVTLDDGIHLLCPRFAFTVPITESTTRDNVKPYSYEYTYLSYTNGDDINGKIKGKTFYDKILYIIFRDNKKIRNIIKIDISKFPEGLLIYYLYYMILVLNNKVVNAGTEIQYPVTFGLSYLHIPYNIEYNNGDTGLLYNTDIFIDNLRYNYCTPLLDQVREEKYFRILNDYINPWCLGQSHHSLSAKLTGLVKKPLGPPKAIFGSNGITRKNLRSSIKTPFFTVEVNPCYIEKEK